MQFSEPAGDTLFFVVLPSILFLFSSGTLIWLKVKQLAVHFECSSCIRDGYTRHYLEENMDVHVRRAAILCALPAYLQEDDSNFLKTWDVEQSNEPGIDDVPLGLLSICGNSTDATFFCPEKIAVVLEVCSTGDKIIGGYECPPHSQPWQAYLTNGRTMCGGSLIDERWVVSAAHCKFSPRYLKVRLGKHKVSIPEDTEQLINAEKVIRHPNYNDKPHNNDIMLIKLSKTALFNKYVKPIRLATNCSSAGEQCLVSGWGKTGGQSASLQCLNLPVLSNEQCRGAYGARITRNMFCAGFMAGGKDSCQGDSGGPVVCKGKLKGVVSWGRGCAQPGFPGVYVELCRYTDWIKSIIANN